MRIEVESHVDEVTALVGFVAVEHRWEVPEGCELVVEGLPAGVEAIRLHVRVTPLEAHGAVG